jgi:hypothetical protein
MNKKHIEHPLRTIVLEYNEAKTVTEYEKELVNSYVLMHDQAKKCKDRLSKIKYDSGILADHVKEAEKLYVSVLKKAEDLLAEAETLQPGNSESPLLIDFNKRFDAFFEEINHHHEITLNPLVPECDAVYKEYGEFEAADEKLEAGFEHFNDVTCAKLYENFNDYSLDMASFDDDLEDFRAVFDTMQKTQREYNRDLDTYDNLIELVKVLYEKAELLKKKLGEVWDDKGLFDSSLSDSYANGTGNAASKPIYMLPPGSASIAKFRTDFALMANSAKNTFHISVPPDVVEQQDVSYLQDIVAHLQHFPQLIEKFIFALVIDFLDHDKIKMPEDRWKGFHTPMRWFARLQSLPCMIFFLQDADARAYTLMGDLVADNKLIIEDERHLSAKGETADEIQNRIFTACWFFHLYCHNTGFDPQPYVEALMAEFDAAFSYEDLRKQYEEDAAKGIQIALRPVDKKK